MHIDERSRGAKFELLGAGLLCIAVLVIEALADPDGPLWSLILFVAPGVFVVHLGYLIAVAVLRRRAERLQQQRRGPSA